jgi:flagellar basal-body rod modification protein FlgD
MAIDATQATSSQTTTTPLSSKNREVTKEDFLKLLISQMQNQDPLKPLDNQEFAQQLATFNSLEQLIGVNEKLGSLSDKLLQANQFNATSLLGKQVVADGNQISLTEAGQKTKIHYQLSSSAAQVFVEISNSQGQLVRRIPILDKGAGSQSEEWNGKNSAGQAAPAGLYTFQVTALDRQGKNVDVTPQVQGAVTGVSLDGTEPILDVGGRRVPLSGVTGVR